MPRLAVALLVAGTTWSCAGDASRATAHGRVACVGCHRAGADAAGRSGVPDASCATSRCHPTGGPERVRVNDVAFDHLRHPDGRGSTVPCAACHSHQKGSSALRAGTGACALCHRAELAGTADTACATCHTGVRHSRATSQGVELRHADLREAHVSCTRCHYRLVQGTGAVAGQRCVACHPAGGRVRLPPDPVAADSGLTGDSAHGTHREHACRACHETVVHRVVAMSSAVDLDCLTCHAARHRRPLPSDSVGGPACGTCHERVHQDQQRLVLGLLPDGGPMPSAMFMGGVTCRSCHVTDSRPPPAPGASLRGTPAACTGCHGGAWTGVLERWHRGYARRRDMVNGYLQRATAALADSGVPPAAHARLREAATLMAFIQRAGPLHNLPVTDQYMRRALALGGQAYRLADRRAPAAPILGPAVANGTCLTCHYGIEEAALGRDSVTGRATTHADHLFRAGLTCDACHAVGAAPPGFAGKAWIDSVGAARRPPPRP